METRPGYALSAAFVILGSLLMVLIDVHRKNLRDKRREAKNCKQCQRNTSLLKKSIENLSVCGPRLLSYCGFQKKNCLSHYFLW